MPTPERLFDSLNTYDDMKNLIGREIESLYIEFKKTADGPLRMGSNADNFARALSGFANSAGGVLVWGMDEQQGIATELKPFPDFKVFEADCNDMAGQWVIPTLDGFRVKSIESADEPGKGFVIMLAPQSDRAPHINQRTHRYYQRSGASFVRMEHFQIEDMFGRRPRPVLDCFLNVEIQNEGSRRLCNIAIFAVNNGNTSAHYPACKVRFSCGELAQSRGKDNIKVTFDNGFIAYEKYEVVIHPGMQTEIANFNIDPEGENFIEFSITIYSENMLPGKFRKVGLLHNQYPVDTNLKLPAVIDIKYLHKHLSPEYFENEK